MKNIKSTVDNIANSTILCNRTAFVISGGIFMEKICGIYKITSPSKKVYIGQSIDIYTRIKKYRSLHCDNQLALYNSIKKYGWNNHIFEVIQLCDQSELDNLEIYYIDLFNTFNSEYGLNLKTGGRSNCKLSDETKEKIRQKRKCQIMPPISEETRKKLSEWQIGRKHSDETKKKIGEKSIGRIFTEETRKKMGIKGNKHRLGKKHSLATKKRISESRKRNKYAADNGEKT